MTPPLLEAQAISAGYGAYPIIHDISLSLAAGESVAIVGPNAAGKSTLLRALAGALPVLSGEIRLQGTPLAALPSRERARRLALVPQAARYDLEFTVRELVALGRAPYAGTWGLEAPGDTAVVAAALADCDLARLADRPYTELSGGERQRALFARALAQKAPLLLLDEPTAHLDLGHQLLVLERVQAHVQAGGGALVVLHDLALAARLGRIAVIDGGRLVASGPPVQVLTPARLEATWGVRGELVWGANGPTLALAGRAASRYSDRNRQ